MAPAKEKHISFIVLVSLFDKDYSCIGVQLDKEDKYKWLEYVFHLYWIIPCSNQFLSAHHRSNPCLVTGNLCNCLPSLLTL